MITIRYRKTPKRIYLYMLMLIGVSGFPILTVNDQFCLPFLLFIFCLEIVLNNTGFFINKNAKFFIILFVLIFIVQYLKFNYFSLNSFLGLIIRLLLAVIGVKIFKNSFLKAYTNTMLFIAIISLIIFIPSYINVSIYNFLESLGVKFIGENGSIKSSLFFYDFLTPLKNTGPFWENAAFGGFLLMALFFNLFYFKKGLSNKQNLIFLIAVLSTLSTTSYIVLAILLIMYFINNSQIFLVLPLLVFIVLISWISFKNIDFLGTKVVQQLEMFQDYKSGNINFDSQRFISSWVDMNDFIKNPFFGAGISNYTRYNLLGYDELEYIRTNGWMDFLVKFGLIGFLIYFITLFKSFKNFFIIHSDSNKLAIYFLILIFFIGFSELYFYLPFFWTLTAYGLLKVKTRKAQINRAKFNYS